MAKRVIVLDRNEGQPVVFNVVFWLSVPAGRENYYKRPVGTKSLWAGAVQAELDAFVAGTVYEVVDRVEIPTGATLTQIENELESRWNAKQNDLNSTPVPARYGTFWDSVGGWTVVNN